MGLPKENFDVDVEQIGGEKSAYSKDNGSGDYTTDEGAVPAETFVIGDGVISKMQRFAGNMGVEQKGIQRVEEHEREGSLSSVGTLWLSANMVVSSFAIGALAYPIFYLGYIDTVLIIIFINLLGIIPVCFFSTFGPRFGLRQMVLSRFYFGWYGVKIIAFFNILAAVGWSSVNVIVGAQLFHAVNNNMPGYAGVILIAALTFIITCFGYKIVHAYERFSWAPCFIIFLIILGWTSYAADYTVYQPVNRSRKAVFGWTWMGLIFPLLFTEILGATVASAMANNEGNNPFMEGYHHSHIGGLIHAVLVPTLGKFGEFCLVILALSIVANNCPNIYSVGLSLQLMSRKTQAVPRYVWTFIGTLIYCAIAIPGYGAFESVLENFMLLIAYWLAIYEGISIPEHVIFRRGFGGYNVEDYMNKDKLPVGIAAITAFAIGAAGAVLGMAQVWFTGPIGKLCGAKFGGDVGFELAFVFAAVSYIPMRYFEKKKFGR